MVITYDVYAAPDDSSFGYTDVIDIIIDSDNPGGEPGEFADFMRAALAEWYDGASVLLGCNKGVKRGETNRNRNSGNCSGASYSVRT